MSGIRGIGDGYAFQRLLWLFVGTVIAPTVVLAGAGFLALQNQKATFLDHADRARSDGVAVLVGQLQSMEADARALAAQCDAARACDLTLSGATFAHRWPIDAPTAGTPDLSQHVVVEHNGIRYAWLVDVEVLRDSLDRGAAASLMQAFTQSTRGDGFVYAMLITLLAGTVVVGGTITLVSAWREIRLSRLQTDFVSNVSHELRTPLTSIGVFVELLQSGRVQNEDKAKECLDLIAIETDRLSRRIERVLYWARMEAGRRAYAKERTAARDIVDAALRAVRSHDLQADEWVTVRPLEGVPDLVVDRDATVEALINLLQNAHKHTPPPREIVLSVHHRDGSVGFSVKDNGPGIRRREQKRIFEKFYQSDARLSALTQGDVDRGSGLGLSIVRAVARAHGGRVDLASDFGHGSVFTLWLPATRTGTR